MMSRSNRWAGAALLLWAAGPVVAQEAAWYTQGDFEPVERALGEIGIAAARCAGFGAISQGEGAVKRPLCVHRLEFDRCGCFRCAGHGLQAEATGNLAIFGQRLALVRPQIALPDFDLEIAAKQFLPA